jgi:preprotein translocase SecE subunit
VSVQWYTNGLQNRDSQFESEHLCQLKTRSALKLFNSNHLSADLLPRGSGHERTGMKRILNLIKDTIRFFQNVVLELKLVEWLSLGQVVKSTIIVAIAVTIFVFILVGMDKLLVSLRELLLNRPLN